ncbi:MAG: hypothetical protein WA579_16810, partial [Rhodomicrobium sp.]
LKQAQAALTCRKGAFADNLSEEENGRKRQGQIGPMEARHSQHAYKMPVGRGNCATISLLFSFIGAR